MAGFGNNRVATGVHDDLYGDCRALAAGNDNLVMCASDLIGLFYDDVLKVREKVKSAAPGVTAVIVASTHDHEGPDTMGLWGPMPLESGMDENYMNGLDGRIAETAVKAVRAEQPAVLTLGRDDHPLLALLQDDSRPPYVKDPYLFVMKLDSASTDQPISPLVTWSDHFRVAGALGVYKGRKPLYTDGQLDSSTSERELAGLGKLKYAAGHDLETEVDYIQLRAHGKPAAEIATVPGEIYPELINGGIARYPGADFPDAPLDPTVRARLNTTYQIIFRLA